MLKSYGWSDKLQAQFQIHTDRGLVPGRVTVQQRGLYRLATPDGDLSAELSGKLAHEGSELFSDRGGVWFALGCMLERADDLLAADKAFAKASRCIEDPVGTPYRIGWKAFQQVVASVCVR